MVWPAIIGAGASLLGAGASARGQRDVNRQNLAIAREQMAFQERMSSTAHQREVKDLRAAGLNPILSATGGAGAPGASGASAQMQNPEKAYERASESAVQSALAIALQKEQLRNIREDTNLKKINQTYTNHQSAKVLEEGLHVQSARRLLDQALPAATAEGNLWRDIENFSSTATRKV